MNARRVGTCRRAGALASLVLLSGCAAPAAVATVAPASTSAPTASPTPSPTPTPVLTPTAAPTPTPSPTPQAISAVIKGKISSVSTATIAAAVQATLDKVDPATIDSVWSEDIILKNWKVCQKGDPKSAFGLEMSQYQGCQSLVFYFYEAYTRLGDPSLLRSAGQMYDYTVARHSYRRDSLDEYLSVSFP